jgi:xylulokinase
LHYLAGSGAPDYDSAARAALLGLTLAHGRPEIARAILEGTSVELVRILDAARESVPIRRVVATGGGARSRLLLEMLANLAGVPVEVAPHVETTLIGAGILAWVSLGRWPDIAAAAAALPPPVETVAAEPEQRAAYRALYARYLATLADLRPGRGLRPGEEAPDEGSTFRSGPPLAVREE